MAGAGACGCSCLPDCPTVECNSSTHVIVAGRSMLSGWCSLARPGREGRSGVLAVRRHVPCWREVGGIAVPTHKPSAPLHASAELELQASGRGPAGTLLRRSDRRPSGFPFHDLTSTLVPAALTDIPGRQRGWEAPCRNWHVVLRLCYRACAAPCRGLWVHCPAVEAALGMGMAMVPREAGGRVAGRCARSHMRPGWGWRMQSCRAFGVPACCAWARQTLG